MQVGETAYGKLFSSEQWKEKAPSVAEKVLLNAVLRESRGKADGTAAR